MLADQTQNLEHNAGMATSSILIRAGKKAVQGALKELRISGNVVSDGSFSRLTSDQLTPKNLNDAWLIGLSSPLPDAARQLSAQTKSLTLTHLNWDGEWLKLWAFDHGELAFQFDSNPSFVTCTVSSPQVDAPGVLAELFGVPDRTRAVTQLLQRRKGLGFITENQRFDQLLELLNVPKLEPMP